MEASTADGGSLLSLVYVSSGRALDDEQIREILRISRQNNQALQITGLLAYHDGNFLQVLEGPASSVRRKMNAIERDPRHSGLIILASKPITERLFPEWSMAFRNLKDLTPEEAEAYSPLLNGSLLDEKYKAEPNFCYRLLLTFKQNIR